MLEYFKDARKNEYTNDLDLTASRPKQSHHSFNLLNHSEWERNDFFSQNI